MFYKMASHRERVRARILKPKKIMPFGFSSSPDDESGNGHNKIPKNDEPHPHREDYVTKETLYETAQK